MGLEVSSPPQPSSPARRDTRPSDRQRRAGGQGRDGRSAWSSLGPCDLRTPALKVGRGDVVVMRRHGEASNVRADAKGFGDPLLICCPHVSSAHGYPFPSLFSTFLNTTLKISWASSTLSSIHSLLTTASTSKRNKASALPFATRLSQSIKIARKCSSACQACRSSHTEAVIPLSIVWREQHNTLKCLAAACYLGDELGSRIRQRVGNHGGSGDSY